MATELRKKVLCHKWFEVGISSLYADDYGYWCWKINEREWAENQPDQKGRRQADALEKLYDQRQIGFKLERGCWGFYFSHISTCSEDSEHSSRHYCTSPHHAQSPNFSEVPILEDLVPPGSESEQRPASKRGRWPRLCCLALINRECGEQPLVRIMTSPEGSTVAAKQR